MKTNKNKVARSYTSLVMQELLDEITPIEMQQTKTKMELAGRLEELIEELGITKTKFSELLGKQPSEITKWVSGTQNFTMDTLTHIAHVLKVDLSDLLKKKKGKLTYVQHINFQVISAGQNKYHPYYLENSVGLPGLNRSFSTENNNLNLSSLDFKA